MFNIKRTVLLAFGSHRLVACFSVFVLVVAGMSPSASQVISGSVENSSEDNDHLGQKPPLVSSFSGQTATQEPLVLAYVANMGVLISSGNSKVMIDCLFGVLSKARFPGPVTLDSMMSGIPPYDDVDLVLVTHRDPDHFDSAVVMQYMLARPEPILVVPADAAKKLRAAQSDWSKIESRVVILDLEIGKILDTVLANIPVTIVRTTHGQSARPMNLMYLFEVSGWRVFHEGDASGRSDGFLWLGLDTVPVDLAVVQHGWPMHPHQPYRLFFQNDFKADHIALGHVALKLEATAESELDKVRKHYNDIFVLLPGMPAKFFWK